MFRWRKVIERILLNFHPRITFAHPCPWEIPVSHSKCLIIGVLMIAATAAILDLAEDLFHRPARGELRDDEVQQHDAEQRWQDQQQPSGDISAHQAAARIILPARLATRRLP